MNQKVRIPPWVSMGLIFSLFPGIITFIILWIMPPIGIEEKTAQAMRGFTNLWFAGSIDKESAGILYNNFDYNTSLENKFGLNYPKHIWGYPPSMLLISLPFSFLPIFGAFLVWSFMGIIMLMLSFIAVNKNVKLVSSSLFFATLVSPAVIENLLSGQTGALTGALLIGGLFLCTSSPRLSGILFGILAIKPQMGFLIPFYLIFSKQWLPIIWAILSFSLMALIFCSIYNPEIWIIFIRNIGNVMSNVISAPWTGEPAQANFTSPFMAFKALGFPLNLSWLLQLATTCFCIILCAWTTITIYNKKVTLPDAINSNKNLLFIASFICLDLLSAPYSHNYDMPVMAFAVAIVIRDGLIQNNLSYLEIIILCVAWIWPGIVVLLPIIIPEITFLCPVVSALSLLLVALIGIKRLIYLVESSNPLIGKSINEI